MYFQKKLEILKGSGGSRLWNSEGIGGGLTHFGISEGKGGLKYGSRPWLGMDIFWNCPMYACVRICICYFCNGFFPSLCPWDPLG